MRSMRTYGQTDTKKLIVAFRNFANAPKKRNSSVNCLAIPVTPAYVFVRHAIPHTCVSSAVTKSLSGYEVCLTNGHDKRPEK